MTEKQAPDQQASLDVVKVEERSRLLVWSSLVFAVLQSLCTALVALSGVRTLIGASALVLSSTSVLERFHQPAIRVPMLLLSALGAFVDLGVLWQIRRLRRRPASQWRQRPATARKRRAETAQLVLSVCTLLLVATESAAHHHLHGTVFGGGGPAPRVSRYFMPQPVWLRRVLAPAGKQTMGAASLQTRTPASQLLKARST